MNDLLVPNFPEGIIKLHQGDDPMGMMGFVLRDAKPKINRGEMSCDVIISAQAPDRAGDVVISKGGIFDDHRKIPVVCLVHNRSWPIGNAEDKLGKYMVNVDRSGTMVKSKTHFDQSSEIGEQSFRLVETKVFRGASIGFMPVQGMAEMNPNGGRTYKQWKLIEYSHIPIPEHQDCIVEAVYKGFGGKPLCMELDGLLRPLCPPKNETVTSGFDAATLACRVEPLPEAIENDANWRTKMYGDDQDTLLGGNGQQDDMTDPNDPNMAGGGQDQTEQAWLTIAIDLVQQAMAHDDGALKKLGMLLKTRKKLIGSGDDGDMMDLGEDPPEEEDEDGTDDFGDEEMEEDDSDDEAVPTSKKKKKPSFGNDKGLSWRKEDVGVITMVYKFLTSALCTANLDRGKLDRACRKMLDQIETIRPVSQAIVEKKLKSYKPPVQEVEQESDEDMTAIILALDESDKERESRCRERDKKLFSIFGR